MLTPTRDARTGGIALAGVLILGAGLLTAGCVTPPPPPVAERPAPNIVLVLADDLGIGDLRAYNPDSKIPTPNLDRLAAEGVRLTDAHSPSAVCTPTRYGLLAGRYAWRTSLRAGVLDGYSPLLLEPGRPTIASVLGAAGYDTACIGKWHLGLGAAERVDYDLPLRPGPLELGFGRFFGIPASLDMPPYLFVRDDRPVAAASLEVDGSEHRRQGGEGFWRAGAASPDFRHADVLPRLAEETVAYLRERAETGKPFFLYLALSAPHTPWLPAEGYRGVSQAGPYGDFVAMVDASIGRVLDALDRQGLSDDTLVLVTSDNGSHWPVADIERYGHAANLHYRGQKADIWEGGHRVPFVARWPGRIPAGSRRDELVCLTDLFATVARAAEVSLPPGAAPDSVDCLDVLAGRTAAVTRGAVVHHSMAGLFALRRGRWKLIEGLGSGGFTRPRTVEAGPGEAAGQLYDLFDDPTEQRNLYLDRPEVVAELTQLLRRIRGDVAPSS